jgi:hypothetical protein
MQHETTRETAVNTLGRIAVIAALLAGVVYAQNTKQQTAPKVDIVAYINQTSGCQKPTETFLRKLDEKYGDRVTLEFVDFGTPDGARRWRGDGLHCMGIRLNGSTKADIVRYGVPLTVAFEMPAGFMWTHEELETAVRQMLQGVADADRQPPQVATEKKNDETVLTLAGKSVFKSTDAAAVNAAADALKQILKDGGMIQEDFTMKTDDGKARLSARGITVLSLTAEDLGGNPNNLEEAAAERFGPIVAAFPRKSRPFPGMGNARRR